MPCIKSSFATRDVAIFTDALCEHAGLSIEQVRPCIASVIQMHTQIHQTLEFLSEMAFRAKLYAQLLPLLSDSEKVSSVHDVLCCIDISVQPTVLLILSQLGVHDPFWEDVVKNMQQR